MAWLPPLLCPAWCPQRKPIISEVEREIGRTAESAGIIPIQRLGRALNDALERAFEGTQNDL